MKYSSPCLPAKRMSHPFFGVFMCILLGSSLQTANFNQALASDEVDVETGRTDISAEDIKRVRQVTKPTTNFSKAERFESMQGGAGTSRKIVNRDAFSHNSANITFGEEQDFKLGNALFRKLWVSSPSSTQASDGLGPLYNARSCQSCHVKDGRGRPPEPGEAGVSMFLRLARPAATAAEKSAQATRKQLVLPDPVYGSQLQNFAVPGLKSEGVMKISYDEVPTKLADGTIINLRRPSYSVDQLAYGPLAPDTTLSPRVAPPMIGLGLVEQIHPADILSLADPEDRDGDGISGKPQLIMQADAEQPVLARFGWKAANTTIRSQSAGAFAGDIGISTPDVMQHHGDCTEAQAGCRALPTGVQKRLGDSEAPDPVLDLVTFYSQHLAVPARRRVNDPDVLEGKRLFYKAGCASCHTPKFVTRRDAPNKAQQFQLIWPYSDFLLHDMGQGLADGQTVGAANGREWRTPPLWGVGLTQTVSGHTLFLHDGRARNLTEAILWHDGEAKASRDAFTSYRKKSRDALIQFLESL